MKLLRRNALATVSGWSYAKNYTNLVADDGDHLCKTLETAITRMFHKGRVNIDRQKLAIARSGGAYYVFNSHAVDEIGGFGKGVARAFQEHCYKSHSCVGTEASESIL